ncbi:fungal-specific transcription factor domain-containing protein [Aspergillus pseudotamarii]|uniref:Fungal-specific transcription factor domain-containing protein n=1 Tax=Aspergillus pseudotamarii TaxID=132259 RepID=A0A5N6T1L8_ASPPS|nr:fungal-specific transcription factor domain-containing protein [Aspergillus pseudotamarii]KAE8139974.1 fungal-specific transcription factor domain-containing protein [Aspergillus pseudotamarii]
MAVRATYIMQKQRRPYRSHKVPACDRCRRFKRRCTGGTPEQPCVLCSLQEVPCIISSRPKLSSSARHRVKHDQRRVQTPRIVPFTPIDRGPSPAPADGEVVQEHIGRNYHGSPGQDQSKVELSMFASPVISEDIQILERYMSSKSSSLSTGEQSGSSDTPMVYLRAPRRREGLSMAANPGKRQKEIVMQVLQPYTDELVRLYFEEIHPAFPLLDEQLFMELYKAGDKLSPVLVCYFFSVSLILWHHSPVLRQFPKPDVYFIWNLAVEALQQDFLAPALSTMYSVLLDMGGRPIYSMLVNTINNGRAVTLAQTLGLNRDPTNWRRPRSEKSLRIRLWWAVVIHDRWSSFAHGISPSITKSRYDVPIPMLEDIITELNQSDTRIKAANSFIHLCTLTEILGEVLPLVYDLNLDPKETWKQIRRLEIALDEWEDRLPNYLRRDNGENPRVSGSSSLQLSYLAVRLLLNRISLHAATLSADIDRLQTTRYHLSQLRKSAQEIVNYVCSLTKTQLQEFWLPYTAHHLILTVIILLRCTIESTDKTTISTCKTSLQYLWTKLQTAADEGWDLATMCISQCKESVSKVLDSDVRGTNIVGGEQQQLHLQQGGDGRLLPIQGDGRSPATQSVGGGELLPDILPFSNPDISFDNQWDLGSLYGLGWMGMDGFGAYEAGNQGGL